MRKFNKLTHIIGKTAVAALVALLLTGCGDTSTPKPAAQFIPVKTQTDGKWGMLAPDGKMLFADRFENEPSIAIEGAFSVREGKNYNLYTAESTPSKINKKPLISAGCFSDGLAPVSFRGSRITLIDSNGDEKATLMPVDGHELVKSDICFHDGMLVVTTPEGKFGYVDRKGEAAVKPLYDAALPFMAGHAMVGKAADAGNPASPLSISIIDKKGNVTLAVEPSYTVVDLDFENDRIIVTDVNGRFGFLNFDNEFQPLPAIAKYAYPPKDGVFVFGNDKGLCGVMNLKSEIIIQPKYNHIGIVSADKFICSDGKEWNLTADDGSKIAEFGPATDVTYVESFGFFVIDKITSKLFDSDGKKKGNLTFYGLGFNDAACSSVISDWKSDERIAADIASIPSYTGIGNIPWGTPAEQLIPTPDNASGIYAPLPQLSLSGVEYTIEGVGVFSAPIAATAEAQEQESGFNPNAFIAGADLLLLTETEITPALVAGITAGLQKRGFTISTAPDPKAKGAFFVMSGQQTSLIFCAPYNGYMANIFLYKTAGTELGLRWKEILRTAADKGTLPDATALFGEPAKTAPAEEAGYIDRTPGSRISSRDISDNV